MYTICLIQAVAFLDLLAVGLVVPLVAAHVKELGGSHIHIGLLGSIYAGFQLCSGPLIGSLSDVKGRRPILIMTLLLCSIAYVVLGITNTVYVILCTRAFLGVFKQTQMLTKALVPAYEKNEQTQSDIYGKMAAISGVGITLGPVIGGHIAENDPENGFRDITLIVGACFVINAGLVYFLPTNNLGPKKTVKNNQDTSLFYTLYSSVTQSFTQLYHINWSRYWDVFLLKALMGFAMSIYYSNYALYLKTEYELSPKYIGYMVSFQGVVGSICSYFMGYINSFYTHDKDYSLRSLHVFLLLSISLLGLILSFNLYVYALWLIPLAIGNAVGRLATLEMVLNRSHGSHAGTLIGASHSMRSLSATLAPMVSGVIGEYFGLEYAIYASLCSTILGTVLCYWHKTKLKYD